jgi:single-stranded DNA-binding protein
MRNDVRMIGVIKEDPKLHQISESSFYYAFEVGTDRIWRDAKTNKMKRMVDWIPVVAWSKGWIADAIRAGDLVAVDGRLQFRNMTDPESGKAYANGEVVAERVENVSRWRSPLAAVANGKETGVAERDYYGDPLNPPLAR